MEHTNPRQERLLGRMVFSGVSWVIFHVWAAIYNGVRSIDHGDGHSYGWQGYALTAAYLLSLLGWRISSGAGAPAGCWQNFGLYAVQLSP